MLFSKIPQKLLRKHPWESPFLILLLAWELQFYQKMNLREVLSWESCNISERRLSLQNLWVPALVTSLKIASVNEGNFWEFYFENFKSWVSLEECFLSAYLTKKILWKRLWWSLLDHFMTMFSSIPHENIGKPEVLTLFQLNFRWLQFRWKNGMQGRKRRLRRLGKGWVLQRIEIHTIHENLLQGIMWTLLVNA